jgi:hypothetical protein
MIATPQPKAKPYSAGYIPHPTPHGDEYDDTLMSKEEYFAKLDRSLEEIKQGKGHTMLDGETLDDFLTRIHGCID